MSWLTEERYESIMEAIVLALVALCFVAVWAATGR